MKVLILSHGMDGGINRVSTDFIKYLKRESFEGFIVRIGERHKFQDGFLRDRDTELDIFLADKDEGVLARSLTWWFAALKIRRFIQGGNFDVAILSGLMPAVFFGVLARRCAKKIVLWEHGPQKTFLQVKKMMARFSPKFDLVVSPTQSSIDWMVNNLPFKFDRCEVLSNWVPWHEIKPSVFYGCCCCELKIVVVCRIDLQQKDFATLILAVRDFMNRRCGVPVSVSIFGHGPDAEEVSHLIEVHQLGDVIFLRGHVDNIFSEYPNYNLSILPTRWEGFGLSIAESMAAKVPVISSRVEGVVDLIEDGVNGYLYELGSPQSLSDKMLEFYQLDPDLKKQMIDKAYEDVVTNCDPGRQMNNLRRLLQG